MREDLKSQNLTFTEIAKLVGENWQSLPPAEKEVYESQANASKDKYHRQLAEYKKTPEYRKYAQYLQDFKERQARQSKGESLVAKYTCFQDVSDTSSGQDASKRSRVEPPPRLRHGSTSSSATPSGTTSGSSSERFQESDPPPRRQRGNSLVSVAGSQHSSTAPTPLSLYNVYDDAGASPRSLHFESGSPVEANLQHPAHHASVGHGRARADSMHQSLPSLTDVLDSRQKGQLYPQASAMAPFASSTGVNPPLSMADLPPAQQQAPAPLRYEPSSGGTSVSSAGSGLLPRPNGDGALPIHALLASRGVSSAMETERTPRPIPAGTLTADIKARGPILPEPRGYGANNTLPLCGD